MERKNNSTGFWVGLFLGGLIGAVLIVLMGTREGRKIARVLKRKIENYLKDVEDIVIEKKEEYLEKAGELKEEALDKAEELKDQVIEKIKQVHPKVEDVHEKGREIAEQIGKNFFSKQGKPQG